MGIVHVFNPEHDIALAANLSNFTAPHAGRQLRADLGYLPALWADDADAVLVENMDYAQRQYYRLRSRIGGRQPLFVDRHQLSRMSFTRVEPWGWDLALRSQLLRYGVDCVPAEEEIAVVRHLSHRRTAAQLLPQLQREGTVGESYECTCGKDVEELLQRYGQVIMKAPWSSSGRGLRFLSLQNTPFAKQANWFNNIVRTQGSVMVEPLYARVKDFGMEFSADAEGRIHYEGLSLFHTVNGAYVGNLITTEERKRELLSHYVPVCLLDWTQQQIVRLLHVDGYWGPFGIDMMIVRNEGGGFLLHPCVEINLRRTMGHVALAVSPATADVPRIMRIRLDSHYKLSIRKA